MANVWIFLARLYESTGSTGRHESSILKFYRFCCHPAVGVGAGVAHTLKFYIKIFLYVMGKALSGELSLALISLVIPPTFLRSIHMECKCIFGVQVQTFIKTHFNKY